MQSRKKFMLNSLPDTTNWCAPSAIRRGACAARPDLVYDGHEDRREAVAHNRRYYARPAVRTLHPHRQQEHSLDDTAGSSFALPVAIAFFISTTSSASWLCRRSEAIPTMHGKAKRALTAGVYYAVCAVDVSANPGQRAACEGTGGGRAARGDLEGSSDSDAGDVRAQGRT